MDWLISLFNQPALILSILALLFTVFSFWWMNWRHGKLIVSPPRSYAMFAQVPGKMVLHLPLVFFNNGPMPIVVQNLRVIFTEDVASKPLSFIATTKKLGKDEDRTFATQFPVRGREAVLMVCEFQREPNELTLEEGTYSLQLQARLDGKKSWTPILTFPLNVSGKATQIARERFIPFDNLATE